jgi:hypothetical protein
MIKIPDLKINQFQRISFSPRVYIKKGENHHTEEQYIEITDISGLNLHGTSHWGIPTWVNRT